MIDLKTIDFPPRLLCVQESSFNFKIFGEASQSAFSPIPRAGGSRFKLWSARISANSLHNAKDIDERFEWDAFFHSLDGMSVAFHLHDVQRCLPRGKAGGIYRGAQPQEYFRVDNGQQYSLAQNTRLLGGSTKLAIYEDADQFTDQVVLSGLTPNETVFRPGDLLEIGDADGKHGNLHEVQLLARSDANGRSAIKLNNRLWKPALAGDIVNIDRPKARFILASNEQGASLRSMLTASASAEVIEVPYQ